MSSLSSAVLSNLPYLRRFARGLTGRQESGDAYVASMLEALIADPSLFPSELDAKKGLYRLFLKTWDALPVNGEHRDSMGDDAQGVAERRFEALAPRPRQAFLLLALEGFTAADAATILDVTPDEFASLLRTANREIAEQVATDVLIIEDEPLIAHDLQGIVTSIGHRVVQIARTHKEALKAFKGARAKLVLADIQLADGSSGIDAVIEILEEAEVPIIFITAYPEQLLTGLRPEPTFLIPKPFRSDTVKAVVSQALFFDVKAKSAEAA